MNDMGGGAVGAVGTDTDGFAPGMPPRTGPPTVQYGGSFTASSDGGRTWFVNRGGVVHYGSSGTSFKTCAFFPAVRRW